MRVLITSIAGALLIVLSAAVASADTTVLVAFDPAAGEFPEGVVVAANGDIFVGMAVTGVVKRITPDGQVSDFGSVPGVGSGFMTGLALDGFGNVIAAVASFDENHGIWLIPGGSTPSQRIVETPIDGLPNAIIFDSAGQMYVSDTIHGVIYRVDEQGIPQIWASDSLLLGIIPVVSPLGFPLGVNGIAFSADGTTLYAAVTEHARVVSIAVNSDGSAGAISIVAEDPALAGADGLVLDGDGVIIVAANGVDSVVAVDPDGTLTTLAVGEPLRFPASLAFDASGETIYVTNFDAARMLGLVPGDAAPSLAAVDRSGAAAPAAPGPSDTGTAGLLGDQQGPPLGMLMLLAAAVFLGATIARWRLVARSDRGRVPRGRASQDRLA